MSLIEAIAENLFYSDEPHSGDYEAAPDAIKDVYERSARACLQAVLKALDGYGWAAVPKERMLTGYLDMVEKGQEAYLKMRFVGVPEPDRTEEERLKYDCRVPLAVWKAMVAAAPSLVPTEDQPKRNA